MSLLGGKPKGGSKILGNSLQIACQWDKSAIGAYIDCMIDGNIPRYFSKASFGECMRLLGLDFTILICGDMSTANMVAVGACANCMEDLTEYNANLPKLEAK